LSIGYYPV